MKTTREEVEKFIYQLEIEADDCEEIGSSFSSSEMREEADRLKKLLARGIIPQITK
jgi:hypothetical protein